MFNVKIRRYYFLTISFLLSSFVGLSTESLPASGDSVSSPAAALKTSSSGGDIPSTDLAVPGQTPMGIVPAVNDPVSVASPPGMTGDAPISGKLSPASTETSVPGPLPSPAPLLRTSDDNIEAGAGKGEVASKGSSVNAAPPLAAAPPPKSPLRSPDAPEAGGSLVAAKSGSPASLPDLSASVLFSASPVQPVFSVVVTKETLSESKRKSPLDVEMRSVRGELPCLISHFVHATSGKEEFLKLKVRRLLNLSGPYPVVDLTLLTALEMVVNHKINDNAEGRAPLGIRTTDKVKISHLFHGAVGSSEDSVVAALLFTGEGAALDRLRYFARRGYLTFDSPGTDKIKYSGVGRKKFLSGIMTPENFEFGVVKDCTLYLPVYNTTIGRVEIFSNSADFSDHKNVSIAAVLEAATASPDLFSPVSLPIGKDELFQDGSQGFDSVYSICQTLMAGTRESSYQIVSISSEPQEVGPVSDVQSFLRRTRQMANQSLATKFSSDIYNARSPVVSFASFQFKESRLRGVDNYGPSHVRGWVNIGLQSMHSEIFKTLVEQLGFKMPEPEEILNIERQVINYVLNDLESPVHLNLPPAEQQWLKRCIAKEARTLAFDTYSRLSFKGRHLSIEQRNAMLNAITLDLSRDTEAEKWYGLWSAKVAIPLSEAVHKGHEFAKKVEAYAPLTLENVSSDKPEQINDRLKNFMAVYTSNAELFGSKVDEYTPFLTRIYFAHLLRDIKDTVDPALLRIYQAKWLQKAYDNLPPPRSVRNSREYKLAEDFGKIIDEMYGPAKSK